MADPERITRHPEPTPRPEAQGANLDSNLRTNGLAILPCWGPNRINTKMSGSPAWIRTTIHGSKGRCPTIRRPGKIAQIHVQCSSYFASQPHCEYGVPSRLF